MVARLLVLIATLAGCDEVFRFNRADESTPRSVLRLAGFSPAETLTDFPLLVVLDDTRAARELMLPGAADLRFLDVDGNVLPHQIEQVGTPGGAPLIAWVRVPEVVGASTAIAVSYGRTEVPAAATAPVWSASYVAVWHLADTLADATGNNHEGVALGATSAAGSLAARASSMRPARTRSRFRAPPASTSRRSPCRAGCSSEARARRGFRAS